MRFGPPFDHVLRQDGRRVADQVVGDGDLDLVFLFDRVGGGPSDRGSHSLEGIPDDWQLYAVELAEG